MLKRAQGLIAAVALTLGAAQPAWATVQIVSPGSDVAGQSQLYWAQAWWQWVFSVPQPTTGKPLYNPVAPYNPGIDPTGQYAGANNNGPVFFLAGYLDSSTPVSRTIIVPHGKPVFFPVINDFYVPISSTGAFGPDPPCATLTRACALQAPYLTQVEEMAVQIDSTSLDNAQIEHFRQTSPSYFSVSLPADNVLGAPVGAFDNCVSDAGVPCSNLWTQDGFYITLDDLSVGTHLLQFEGEGSSLASGPFGQDVTVTLVVVPEPSTWAMVSMGFAGLGFAAYRKRRTQRPPVAV